MTTRSGLLVLTACLGCGGESRGPSGPDTPPVVDSGVTTDTGAPVEDTASTGDTGALPIFDCATVPVSASAVTQLPAPRGYNDLVFDAEGAMIGSDDTVLWRATGPEVADIYAAGTGTVYKMDLLPGGDLVAARSRGDGGGLIRVTPNGAVTVLAPGLQAYGLAVGSDGMVYAATNYTASGEKILRVDPDTGEAETLVDATAFPPRAIAFSRDFSRLYIGTVDGGEVWAVSLDGDLDPIGEPELLVTVPTGWHDTLEVDACGNLYVGSFYSWSIFRVHADLSITKLISWDFQHYGHGFEWGDARGGWNEQAIYMTHPYIGSRVDEIVIGVPGARWPGEVVGGATL